MIARIRRAREGRLSADAGPYESLAKQREEHIGAHAQSAIVLDRHLRIIIIAVVRIVDLAVFPCAIWRPGGMTKSPEICRSVRDYDPAIRRQYASRA